MEPIKFKHYLHDDDFEFYQKLKWLWLSEEDAENSQGTFYEIEFDCEFKDWNITYTLSK